jgi:hypothetical protein
VILTVLVIKQLVMVVGSHPFDFATFVYQARSFFEYGVDPLFSWNKGMPLLALFYSQYALYQAAISAFTHAHESTILVHFVYKLPFLCFDVLTGYLLYRCAELITADTRRAQIVALLWFINPFTLWSVEFHGSYAIVATASFMAGLYFLLRKHNILAMALLAVSASVYYFSAIFVPFFLLAMVAQRPHSQVRRFLTGAVAFAASATLMYLPFFFTSKLLREGFVGSLLNHAAPNASSFSEAVQLPSYSLLKVPFFFVTSRFPDSIHDPLVFKTVALFTPLCVLAIATYAAWRYWRYWKTHEYSDIQLVTDLLVSLTLFLVGMGHFQDHYLVWIFPLMYLAGACLQSKALLRNTVFISIVALIGVVGAGSIGVYLLDVLPFGLVSFYMAQSQYAQALAGFTVLVLMLGNLFFLRPNRESLTALRVDDKFTASILTLALLFMGAVATVALVQVFNHHGHTSLGSDANVYNFAYATADKPSYRTVQTLLSPASLPDPGFELDLLGEAPVNEKLASPASPWHIYALSSPAAPAFVTRKAHTGAHGFQMLPTEQSVSQLNMGGSGSKDLVRIDAANRYRASVFVSLANVPPDDVKVSVRFADQERVVIPGSDQVLDASDNALWRRYTADTTPPSNAWYMEYLVSVNTPDKLPAGASVAIDDFGLQTVRELSELVVRGLQPKNDPKVVEQYVLGGSAAKHFGYVLDLDDPANAQEVIGAKLGTCTDDRLVGSGQSAEFEFDPSCASTGKITAQLEVVNYPDPPDAKLVLRHEKASTHHVYYHHDLYILLAAAALAANVIFIGYIASLLRRILFMP